MNDELKIQLENYIQNHIENGEEFQNADNEDDVEMEALKKLESIIKSEPNDSDDDYYYVVVVDDENADELMFPDEIATNETTKKEFLKTLNIKEEIVDNDTATKSPDSLLQEELAEEEPCTKTDDLNNKTNDEANFENTIESFIISDVPVNVPATILENEEESQDTDYPFDNTMNVDDTDNAEGSINKDLVEIPVNDINENKDPGTDMDELPTNVMQILPDRSNNYVKILTTTRADGTIVLKGENITYLTDSQLVSNSDVNEQHDEVILCEEDDTSSQFQILKCDGNDLVIEYADDGQIATVLQQEDGTFLCECGEAFEDLSDFEKHQSCHSLEHHCNLCGKGFESAEILTGHKLLHSVTGLLVLCPFCGQLIKRNSLTQHIKYNHTNIKPRCEICFKTFANPNNLKRHMMIHNGIRQYECDICFKRFHQKITMQTHRLTHVNPLACGQCDQVFANATELQDHKDSNECSKSKLVKVKEELIKTVKQEVTTNTGKLVAYACSLCQKMFSLESALEQHVEQMHMVNPMELLCPECGEVLPSKKEMQAHLHSHKIVKQKMAKRYECSSCGKGCTSQAMLIMHERVHTNERPFACQLCTLRFKTKTHLRTHQLTHTREKKFGCSVCMKFFALKGNLVVHLRTHTGERPYICSICGDAFIDSKYLKKHKLKKHAIDNVPWNQY